MAKLPKSTKIKVELDTSEAAEKIRDLQEMQDTFTRRERQAIAWMVAAVVLFIAENIYFGWNNESESPAESICDLLVIVGFFLSYLWKPVRHTTENFNCCSPKR